MNTGPSNIVDMRGDSLRDLERGSQVELQIARREGNENSQRLLQQIGELQRTNQRLEKEKAFVQNNLGMKDDDYMVLKGYHNELENKYQTLQREFDELRGRMEEYENRDSRQDQLLIDQSAKITKNIKAVFELEKANSDLTNQVNGLKNENDHLKAEVDGLKAKNAAIEATNTSLKGKVVDLEARVNELTSIVERLAQKP